jgi:hypothetical protein
MQKAGLTYCVFMIVEHGVKNFKTQRMIDFSAQIFLLQLTTRSAPQRIREFCDVLIKT